MRIGQAIRDGVTAVTKDWTTVKRKELRDATRGARARERYWRLVTVKEDSIKTIAYRVMADAYAKASGGGQFPATARQVMYAARPLILAATEKPLGKDFDVYFTQQLLPGYQSAYPETTAAWDVIYDARGHLYEPHTDTEIALGTLDVRRYLRSAQSAAVLEEPVVTPYALGYPTTGPRNRYTTVLFLEKEGFFPLLRQAAIGKRFDLALMSSKGMASVAGRVLMEGLSRISGVRFLVLHDFDKAGFSICATLTKDTERYQFQYPPEVIDLGLRLSDVTTEALDAEPCTYHEREPWKNLRQKGASDDEIAFLVDRGGRGGQRVELNAFPSEHLVRWLEAKLAAAGVVKLVPDDATLAAGYRRAVYVHAMNDQQAKFHEIASARAAAAAVPATLRQMVGAWLTEHETEPWDAAVADLAGDVPPAEPERGEP